MPRESPGPTQLLHWLLQRFYTDVMPRNAETPEALSASGVWDGADTLTSERTLSTAARVVDYFFVTVTLSVAVTVACSLIGTSKVPSALIGSVSAIFLRSSFTPAA